MDKLKDRLMNLTQCSEEELRNMLDNGDINILEYLQNIEDDGFAEYCQERKMEQTIQAAYEYLNYSNELFEEYLQQSCFIIT